MTDEVKTSEDAAKLLAERSVGELAEKLGIEILELSAERSVATMPVEGNTQPFGVLHGGAHVVLAETLGSMSANVWAYPDRLAVGIEVNASHSRSAVGGLVTGTCTALNLGKSLTVHEIVVTDEQGRRLSTVRITNFLREKPTR
jgi:1,4-dihydroxy-2-naphthoyl-CoA hydrolase